MFFSIGKWKIHVPYGVGRSRFNFVGMGLRARRFTQKLKKEKTARRLVLPLWSLLLYWPNLAWFLSQYQIALLWALLLFHLWWISLHIVLNSSHVWVTLQLASTQELPRPSLSSQLLTHPPSSSQLLTHPSIGTQELSHWHTLQV